MERKKKKKKKKTTEGREAKREMDKKEGRGIKLPRMVGKRGIHFTRPGHLRVDWPGMEYHTTESREAGGVEEAGCKLYSGASMVSQTTG